MTKPTVNDPYIDPNTGVLKNRLGIADTETLKRTESDIAATKSYELLQNPIKGRFDLEHLQAIHRHLFGEVYEWAGELRTIDIHKGGDLFAHHGRLTSAAASISKSLAQEKHLAGLDAEKFSGRAGYYLGELNALHPFREGNGRTQRAFIRHLAHANGYHLAWEKVKSAEMRDASIAAFHHGPEQLAALIRNHLKPLEQQQPEPLYNAFEEMADCKEAEQQRERNERGFDLDR